jgi:hypothetical protein
LVTGPPRLETRIAVAATPPDLPGDVPVDNAGADWDNEATEEQSAADAKEEA